AVNPTVAEVLGPCWEKEDAPLGGSRTPGARGKGARIAEGEPLAEYGAEDHSRGGAIQADGAPVVDRDPASAVAALPPEIAEGRQSPFGGVPGADRPRQVGKAHRGAPLEARAVLRLDRERVGSHPDAKRKRERPRRAGAGEGDRRDEGRRRGVRRFG